MWRHYNVILENKIILWAISDNWNHLMRLRDMKYIGFKFYFYFEILWKFWNFWNFEILWKLKFWNLNKIFIFFLF